MATDLLRRAERLLTDLEWWPNGTGRPVCLWCGVGTPGGHAEQCRMGALLADLRAALAGEGEP